MSKKKDKENKKGLTESFLGGIPILGDFFKKLAKAEIFQKKFKEVDEQIKENLKKAERKKMHFEANFSIQPIINKIKKNASELVISKDYFYAKKENKLVILVKVPKKEVDLNITNKNLLISSENFKKKIKLPDYYKNIEKKKYKKGMLILELTK